MLRKGVGIERLIDSIGMPHVSRQSSEVVIGVWPHLQTQSLKPHTVRIKLSTFYRTLICAGDEIWSTDLVHITITYVTVYPLDV